MTPDSKRAADAVELVHRDPRLALELADRIIVAPDSSRTERVVALWARGMARRESDDLAGAAIDLGDARAAAIDIGDDVLAANISVTLALVVMYLGETARSRALLDAAEPLLSGGDLGKLQMQRALIDHRSGDLHSARTWYESARSLLEVAQNDVVLARLHGNLGVLLVDLDDVRAAIDHCRLSGSYAERSGQRMLEASAIHNLGYALGRSGDVVGSLDAFDRAERIYSTLPPSPMAIALELDRAMVLRAANLVTEARRSADRALDATRASGNTTDLADAALLAARCRADDRDIVAARTAVDEAVELFARHGRDAWVPVAELEYLRFPDVDGEMRPSSELSDLPARLDEQGRSGEATEARVILAQRLLAVGDVDGAERQLVQVPKAGRLASPTHRAAALLARALLARSVGDRSRARRAVTEGMNVLIANQATLGATELRAHAVGHATDLTRLGSEMAIEDRRPRELLQRAEAAMGRLDLLPRPRPSADEEVVEALAELRGIVSAQVDAPGASTDSDDIRHRRAHLERIVRAHDRRLRGDGSVEPHTLRDAISELGDAALLEFVVVGDRLWSVSVVAGRCRSHDLGEVASYRDDVESLSYALTRLGRSRLSAASADAARSLADAAGRSLDVRLIPPHLAEHSGPLVVVPADVLNGVAWSMLPSVRGRAITVSSSLIGWSWARRRARDEPGAVAIGGPGLPFAAHEATRVAAEHSTARALTGDDATVERCLDALGSCGFAHFACHGTFRRDNPLFSSMRVASGELTFYELERCERLPHTVVVAACDAGVNAVLDGGALLGLSSALIQLGVSSVIAPLTPVNDERSGDLMVRLHVFLAAEVESAEALARASVGPDGELDISAAPFICFGS